MEIFSKIINIMNQFNTLIKVVVLFIFFKSYWYLTFER